MTPHWGLGVEKMKGTRNGFFFSLSGNTCVFLERNGFFSSNYQGHELDYKHIDLLTPGAGSVHIKMMQHGGANSNWEHPFLLPQLLCGWDCRVLAVTPSWPTIKEVKWVLGGFGC